MDQAQRDRKAYELARAYLLSFDGVTPEILEAHLTPEGDHPPALADVYRRLLVSAQNRNMLPGVIGKAIGGIDSLAPLLCDFDPKAVTAKHHNWEAVLDDIVERLRPRGKINRSRRALWPQFCRTIVAGAQFLAQFESAEAFYEWVEFFDQDDRARPALPMLLSYEIDGIGFALACDFLKEIGYTNFGKPDVHLRKIFDALLLSSNDRAYVVFKAIVRVAHNAGVTPFTADRIFWLTASGKFFRAGLQIDTERDAFIAYALERLD